MTSISANEPADRARGRRARLAALEFRPQSGMFRLISGDHAMKPHLVVALVQSPVSIFELGCVVEVFGRQREEIDAQWYAFAVAGVTAGEVLSTGGIVLQVDHGLEAFDQADTIVIPSWDAASPAPPELLQALRFAHDRGARLLSICSGAFLLAEAGVLDGRRATTHWLYAAALQARFPAVKVDPDVLYVDTGQIVTAAGSAAGLDMLLHLVRRDHGSDVCNTVARRLNIPPYRDGGQSQFAQRPVPAVRDSRISQLISWMRDHSTEPLTVEALADRAAMSPRTFFRRFREATGQTPHEWLIGERVAIARELLEGGRLAVDQVAFAAGFGSPEAMRTHFKRTVGLSPADYRKSFAPRTLTLVDQRAA